MKRKFRTQYLSSHRAQTAIEYMLLLLIVTLVVLSGIKNLLPRTQKASEIFYNNATIAIYGKPPEILQAVGP